MKIRDVMTRNVVAVGPRAAAFQVAGLMADNHVGSVAVIKGHRLMGLITDRDLVTRVIAKGRDPAATLAEDLVQEIRPNGAPWPAVHPETDTLDAVRAMSVYKLKRLPVVEGDEVVGIVSATDLASAREEFLLSVLQQEES